MLRLSALFSESPFKKAPWLNGNRVVGYPALILVFGVLLSFAVPHLSLFQSVPIFRGFESVYTAGRAAQEGRAAEAYAPALQKTRESAASFAKSIPWYYPPTFLCVAWLLALLPYGPALVVYLLGSFAAYLTATMALIKTPRALPALAAFPAVFSCAFAGQNGMLSTAFLASGLAFLERCPVLSGVFFGLLSYKPHLFILVPFALFFGRFWKALLSTLLSAAVFAGIALLAFGIEPWSEFIKVLPLARTNILEEPTGHWLGTMHTIFSAARMFGASIPAAYGFQALGSLCVMAALAVLWRRRPSLEVRGAALCGAILLASPYAFFYDQVLLAIPLVLLVREGLKNGFLPYEKIFLLGLWLLPVLMNDRIGGIPLPLTLPMLTGLLWFSARAAQQPPRRLTE